MHPCVLIEALGYAELGLCVVPLYPRSKSPRLDRWPERATADPGTIEHWWGMWPESNLAIVTGNGIIALDIDLRSGGTKSPKNC
jgi:hypothetical protein